MIYTRLSLRGFVSALLLCFCLLFFVSASLAQTSTTGSLTGTVTDPSGAVISGATVTITDNATGAVRTATTDANGSYKFSLLPPGNYDVKFSATGFKTVEVSAVTVNVTETPVLNHALQVGAQSEQITVESTAETIQTQNATNGALVGSKEVTDLPLSSRNYTQIIDLSPGVVVNVSSAAAIGAGTQDINVNGSGSDQNNYLMDGASITNYGSGGGAQSGNYPGIGIPNPDAIQEFKIQTSQYDASYGQNPGASVNVVTKSGTNQFHGSAWEYVHNNFFDANDFFLKQTELGPGGTGINAPQTFKENQFGGTIGGPIKKDKIFFFFSYQGTRQLNGIGTNGFSTGFTSGVSMPPFNTPCGNRADGCTTPIPAQLWGTAAATNPSTSTCGTTGYTYAQYLGCVFSGPVGFAGVPVNQQGSNINPAMIGILQAAGPKGGYNSGYYIPSGSFVPSHPGACGGESAGAGNNPFCLDSIVQPIQANEDQYVANGDYVLSSKHTLTSKLFYAKDPQVQSFVCLGPCMPGGPENATYTTTDSLLKLTSVLSSNFVNEARVSYQREVTNSVDGLNVQACAVGMIPTVNNGQPCPGIAGQSTTYHELTLVPVLNASGIGGGWGTFNAGGNFFAADTNFFNTFQYSDQISWNHGKHAIRAGFEAQRIQWNWTLGGAGRGELIFGNLEDMMTSGDNPFFGGILANLTTRLAPTAPNYHALRVNEFSSFAEDDVKVTRNLTLNIGLRWEYDGFPTDATGLFTNAWASLAEINNTGGFFIGDPTTGAANPIGTLAGYVVQSNYNKATNLGLMAPNGATGVYVNSNKTLEHGAPWLNLAPRLGFAWQPLGNSFVVRGGYGIFYDRIYGNLLGNNQQADPPYAGSIPAIGTLDNPAPEPGTGTLGWIPRTLGVTSQGTVTSGAQAVAGSDLTNNSTSDAANLGTPLIQEYNLDLQYEFKPGWIADIGYVGQHGTHLYDWARNINIGYLAAGAPNEPLASDPQDYGMVVGNGNAANHTPAVLPFNVGNTNPMNQILQNLVANIQGRVPYLGMDPTGLSTTSTVGDDVYNSLQAQLKHQFSHGLLLQVAYTWSNSTTNINSSEAGGGIAAPGNVLSGGGTSNNPNDLRQQYGPAAFNRPQRLVISYSYDLPWKHMEGITGKVLGGWTVSGVTTIQDGEPFTVVDGNGATLYDGSSPFGNNVRALLADPVDCDPVTGNCKSGIPIATSGSNEQRLNNWINTSAFQSFSTLPASAPQCIGGQSNPGGDASLPCGAAGSTKPNAGTGFGNSGVGTILGPGQHNWDISLIKNTKIWESTNLQFRAEFYNVWNHAQFNPPGNNLNTLATFGVITRTSVPARIIDFALKFSF
ncbi:MAG TPA: carboxypeptidase regulatory-like domain-containing protein [Bryobacteraceae bacterium]|nr:carboxypeptidase regulatory-like domain-containing protein [Bryobacteraceae bacterium]